MAASPEIQIQALQSLLEVKENVDKEVHMKCVITALSTAYLDADTALKISAVIEQQNSFSAEDKARLQKATCENYLTACQKNASGKKKSQSCRTGLHPMDLSLSLSLSVLDSLSFSVLSRSAVVWPFASLCWWRFYRCRCMWRCLRCRCMGRCLRCRFIKTLSIYS